MHAAAPAPPGQRRGDVVRVGVAAVAEHLAVDGRAACRARARASRGRRTPAPSAITKPSRSASNGRDARSGSSLRVLSAPMRANAETVSGVTGASVPPATTTSALPSRTMRTPSPMALAPAAHAVAMQSAGPVKPNWIEIMPGGRVRHHHRDEERADAARRRVRGTSTRSPPWSRARRRRWRRSPRTGSGRRRARRRRSSASAAAAKPRCVKRSTRRTSFGPKYGVGSKSRTSQANCTGSSDGSNRSMRWRCR